MHAIQRVASLQKKKKGLFLVSLTTHNRKYDKIYLKTVLVPVLGCHTVTNNKV